MKTRSLSTLLTSALVSIAVLSSCQETLELDTMPTDVKRQSNIEFSNYVTHMTRASKTNKAGSFVAGDTMAVWGLQTTAIGDYTFEDIIFNNQPVKYVDANTWTYSPEKAWNFTSTYMFYGVFPYSKTLYSMSADTNFCVTIPDYTTPNLPDDQKDLMISEKRPIIPDNTVDMVFHHILSNVNVMAKIGANVDTTKIQSVTLKQIKFYNVQATGRYIQTGWNDQNCAVGAWDSICDYMNIPDVTDKVLTKDADTIYKDYLMMPQNLFGSGASPKDASIDAVFRIVYKDGTSSTHVKTGLRLAGITDNNNVMIKEWKPNFRYNYTLAFNPQVGARTWDADGDGSIQIDPATGDTITTTDDTPFPGTMKYSPDDPNTVYVFEDSDGDSIPDTWKRYPVAWEDIDGDSLLEAGIDRNGDGIIDNVDGEKVTQQVPGGHPHNDPTDGDEINNPGGKDVILVHYDTDGDGDVDDDDKWGQIEKDPDTGEIFPKKEQEDRTIQFTATVSEWEQTYSLPLLME